MPAKVTLTAITGPLDGKKFSFDERTTCIVGRAPDCNIYIRIPDGQKPTVSRHHCLLDINPPDICIRDFGSRNGTHVNGRKIGQRETLLPQEADRSQFPEVELQDGDEIRLGKTTFRVDIYIPVCCPHCSAEIPLPDPEELPSLSAEIVCQACGHVIRRRRPKGDQAPATIARCVRCGRNVSEEAGQRPGEYVCNQCRADPLAIMKQMLDSASSGEKKLVPIEGYEVREELGRGTMGAVYLARHQLSGKEVALKIMLPQVAAVPNAG